MGGVDRRRGRPGSVAPSTRGASVGERLVLDIWRHRPEIALTIDDGYNSANCRRIANILRAKNVPATYFPYARVFSGAPATWRYISSRGFRVGNHTVSHPFMTRLSYSSQLQQITRAQRILPERHRTDHASGCSALPYGSYNLDTRRAAGAAGIRYLVLWDTTFADTATMSDAAHFRHAMRGTKGSIILLHCGPASSVRILPRVIAAYRARGLRVRRQSRTCLGWPRRPRPRRRRRPRRPLSPRPRPTPEPSPTPTPLRPRPRHPPSPRPAPTTRARAHARSRLQHRRRAAIDGSTAPRGRAGHRPFRRSRSTGRHPRFRLGLDRSPRLDDCAVPPRACSTHRGRYGLTGAPGH